MKGLNMINQKLLNSLAILAAGYAKRWMEGNLYDKVFETKFGEKFKNLDKKSVYGIEFGLNFLTSILDQKFHDDTALKKFIKEIGMDAASELSKRLINGTREASSDNVEFIE